AAGGHHAEHTATLEAGARTLYLGTGAEILALDGATLKLQQRWALEDAVRHLALSLDGTRLYAALQDRIAVLDALTGKPLGGFPAPEVSSVVRVTP
ncbi:MAG TPA: hypothetical protein VHS99_11795, partial [Chloroflexota bacterium]|nr:hypothetical protein [Chloroflexota bacterium]